MDGTNSSGRRISLLNDESPAYSSHSNASAKISYARNYSYSSQGSSISSPRSLTRLSSFQSRTSSSASTPCLSPLTPHLIRSSSSDSAAEMQTPSPITPEFGYSDSLAAQQAAYSSDHAYFSKDSFAQYSQQHAASLSSSYPANAQAQAAYFHAQPSAEPKVQQPAQKSKKNQYPCPVAKQYNCSDYFTTSGHAARHAKKHTGKKDALCPDCNKAFTRKDNMEQHRRTHLNGRNATKGSEDKSRKVQKQLPKRPKPAPLQASHAALSMVDPALPSLPISPTSTFAMTPTTQQSMDIFPSEYMQQQRHMYPDPSQCTINPGRFELQSPSYGLDTLAAAAASGEKRKYGE